MCCRCRRRIDRSRRDTSLTRTSIIAASIIAIPKTKTSITSTLFVGEKEGIVIFEVKLDHNNDLGLRISRFCCTESLALASGCKTTAPGSSWQVVEERRCNCRQLTGNLPSGLSLRSDDSFDRIAPSSVLVRGLSPRLPSTYLSVPHALLLASDVLALRSVRTRLKPFAK